MKKLILVHGGLSGSYQWKKISVYLENHDIMTTAIQCPGMGSDDSDHIDLKDHIMHIAEVIRKTGDCYLAAFSFGGLAATEACCMLKEHILGLIYVDCFFPLPGESFADIAGPRITRQIQLIMKNDGFTSIPTIISIEKESVSQPVNTIFTSVDYEPENLQKVSPYYIHLAAKNPEWTFTPVLEDQFLKFKSLGFPVSEVNEDHTLNGENWKKIGEEILRIIKKADR